MLLTSFLLMKSPSKTEAPIFYICIVFFVSKGNLLDFILFPQIPGRASHTRICHNVCSTYQNMCTAHCKVYVQLRLSDTINWIID